jgi:hypothetical protein
MMGTVGTKELAGGQDTSSRIRAAVDVTEVYVTKFKRYIFH